MIPEPPFSHRLKSILGYLQYFTGEPTIHELYGIAPQILLGIGAGFVSIALLVRPQSSCSQRTDVAMATALLVTFNKLGGVAGGIVKRIFKAGIIK